MKKTIRTLLLSGIVLLTICSGIARAQSASAVSTRYKDAVIENPNADADIKAVSDYLNSLASGDLEKAKMLMADNYKGYGPSTADSTTKEQTINEWQQIHKTRTNQKVNFYNTTFRVKSGDVQGDWVSIWGDYNFTENGKNLHLPFQFTAHVTNGKIDGSRIYYDRLYLLQMMGYKLTGPDGGQ